MEVLLIINHQQNHEISNRFLTIKYIAKKITQKKKIIRDENKDDIIKI